MEAGLFRVLLSSALWLLVAGATVALASSSSSSRHLADALSRKEYEARVLRAAPNALNWGAHPFFNFREMTSLSPQWNLIKDLPQSYLFAKGRGNSLEALKEDQDMERFLYDQLTRDKRMDATNKFLKNFVALAKRDDPKNLPLWDQAMLTILNLLYAASANDPTYYVSHAADHGVRVMILSQQYQQLEKLTKVLYLQIAKKAVDSALNPDEVIEIARLDPQVGKMKAPIGSYVNLVIDAAHLLHDVGYSGLPYGIPPKFKWTHAVNGAELVLGKLKDSLGKVLPEDAFQLIVESIRSHNWDSKACHPTPCAYTPQVFNDREHNPNPDMFPVGGVGVVPKEKVPTVMVRGFKPWTLKPGDATFGPLQALLRLADNMDAARARLTAGQRDQAVISCQRDLAVACAVADAREKKKQQDPKADLSDDDIAQLKASLKTCQAVKTANAQFYADLVAPKSVNHYSFLHYYSNYVIKKSFLSGKTGSPESPQYELTVEFFNDLPPDLAPSNFIGPALYQLIRGAEATQTITMFDGTTVLTTLFTLKLVNLLPNEKEIVVPWPALIPSLAKSTGKCKWFNDKIAAPQKCFNDGAVTSKVVSPLDGAFTPITPCPA